MPHSLIINQQKNLPLYRRLWSHGMTILLWCFWCYLWWPIVRPLRDVFRSPRDLDESMMDVLVNIPSVMLEEVLVAVVGTVLGLLLFSLLPSRKLQVQHLAYTQTDYAEHYGTSVEVVLAHQHDAVCTVHHDENGHIVKIETGC
jgi:poly-beta-1,6-N-acetyl-D-glucosamine biosynthesis protein PgaD